MADATKLPITNQSFKDDIIEVVQDLRGRKPGRKFIPKIPVPKLVGEEDENLQETLSELTMVLADLRNTLSGEADYEAQRDWAIFPSSGGFQSYTLPTEGGSSELYINFIDGTVSQDGTVKHTFNRFGEGQPARFMQIAVDNNCKMSINSRAAGVIDFRQASSPLSLKGLVLDSLYLIFNTSQLSIQFVANRSAGAMELGREIAVKAQGQTTPLHGTSAVSVGVSGTSYLTLDSTSATDRTTWTGANNTIDYSWGERQKLAAFMLHCVEGSTPEHGISEEIGLQYRPAAGGLSDTLDNWSVFFYWTFLSGVNDFCWYPESTMFFETNSTVRFNITGQNVFQYNGNSALIYPTMITEEF